jgi:serine/threonine-protein kinase
MAKHPDDRWDTATAMVEALDGAMGPSRPPTEPTRPIAAVAPPPPSNRRHGAAIIAGLAGLILIAVVGFVLLSGGDNGRSDGGQQTAEQPRQTETPRKKKESTPTPTPTAESTPEPTATATATPTATPAPPAAGTGVAAARRLQLQGYNARQNGDFAAALTASSAALKACGDAHVLDPCGFALYEVGAALVGLGRNEEAIPYLERRLDDYGDNSARDVQKALDQAQGGKPGKGQDKKDKGND